MATVVGISVALRDDRTNKVAMVSWGPLTAANAVGDAQSMIHSRDRSVQFAGTWDGATVVLQGSNDGTNWATLNDPLGTDISATVGAPIFQIMEATRYVRPSSSGGGGTQSITVTVFCAGGR